MSAPSAAAASGCSASSSTRPRTSPGCSAAWSSASGPPSTWPANTYGARDLRRGQQGGQVLVDVEPVGRCGPRSLKPRSPGHTRTPWSPRRPGARGSCTDPCRPMRALEDHGGRTGSVAPEVELAAADVERPSTSPEGKTGGRRARAPGGSRRSPAAADDDRQQAGRQNRRRKAWSGGPDRRAYRGAFSSAGRVGDPLGVELHTRWAA